MSPYVEDLDSQLPAVQVLCALGWKYLSPAQANELRGGRTDRVILTGVLRRWMGAHNVIETRGKKVAPTDAAISEAIRRLQDPPPGGLIATNEKVYELLTLGTSVEQEIDGDRKGRQLRFLDWVDPAQNEFHVTTEFSVARAKANDTRRPDLVLFVNGIPVAVIECKRRDRDKSAGPRALQRAIAQLLDYQKEDEIPHLFPYAQLLFATSVNDARYGTVGTQAKFWAGWNEEGLPTAEVHAAANTALSAEVEESLFAADDAEAGALGVARQHYRALRDAGDRLPTAQDRLLWSMLRRDRLVQFMRNGVIFDANVRKVARHQQWFAVQRTLDRVRAVRGGQRTGGVIWHTTGSGKSLTMVMLARALVEEPSFTRPRIVLVTDRVDLDKQLSGTFRACGKEVHRATTGENLAKLIREGAPGVITTVIDKFETVLDKHGYQDPNPDVVVMVDEGHRTNYGATAAKMRNVFPNGCFLAFTGTPLVKRDKNTAQRFGGFIHSYTMRAAVEDEAVVRLVYEGRQALLEQNEREMDAWFERITDRLTPAQKAELKRRLTGQEAIHDAEQRLRLVAYDVATHYARNFKGTGLKGQLAAANRRDAVRYREFFRELDLVEAEVVISAPDVRAEDETDSDEKVVAFWKQAMATYGDEKRYLDGVLDSFAREDGIELLIVVSKLLTGFDEPRNTVLYVDKPLRDHNILQAIARVNRLHPQKEFGLVIDYRGILGHLGQAMETYDALAEFDPADVDLGGVVVDADEVLRSLPQHHSDVWEVFKQVANREDNESLEEHLRPEDRRFAFYEVLRHFQKGMASALATEKFHTAVPRDRAERFARDLARFRGLRRSVQIRYADTIDYAPYERQLRRIMDTHINAPEVVALTPPISIFDQPAFVREVEEQYGSASKADTIASRVAKTCREKMEEDPALYTKFATLVQKAIEDYQAKRISDLEYLARMREVLAKVQVGHDADLPGELERAGSEARAFFGLIEEALGRKGEGAAARQSATTLAVKLERSIAPLKTVDFVHSEDTRKELENLVDDVLSDANTQMELGLTSAEVADLVLRVVAVARKQAGG